MCETCGCSDGETTLTDLRTGERRALEPEPHVYVHADGTRHAHTHAHTDIHAHAHAHAHAHGGGGAHKHETTLIDLNASLLAKNDRIAERNRAWLRGREIFAVNLMSAPGAGKTTLLERTLRALAGRPVFVLEGDQATLTDAERVTAAGGQAVQINTGRGCHLDAEMVERGLSELRPEPGSLLFIENVGNLVCPALFDLGEFRRVAILSVTEGDDKPLKYPHMFRAADLLLINKIDLAPHVDFDIGRAIANAREVNSEIETFGLSARTGAGMEAWTTWVAETQVEARAGAFG
jgi:hydrogenase nickel incorporation protein HypB